MANGINIGNGVFPPKDKGGVPNSPNVCNGYTPQHPVLGDGAYWVSPDCSTTLTDCQMNGLASEFLAAVDELGYSFNTGRVDNLGRALVDRFRLQQLDIDTRVKKSGDTMTGPLELVCPPANDNDASCKAYVDQTAAAAADACCTAVRAELATVEATLQAELNNRVRRNGDQMTGPLLLPNADPSAPTAATTKQYVDSMSSRVIISADAPNVPAERLWWDSRTGALFVHFDDGNSLQWVQACGACEVTGGGTGDALPLTGGTLTGPLFLHGAPTAADEAATKNYVDSQIALGGTFVDAPADGQQYIRMDHDWHVISGLADDAPADGQLYARRDNAWEVVTVDGGGMDGGIF